MPDIEAGDLMWSPNPEDYRDMLLTRFTQDVADSTGHAFRSYDDLHAWSVQNPGPFWSKVWEFAGVVGEKPGPSLVDGQNVKTARFFPSARLNYAENCLRQTGAKPAILFRPETGDDIAISWDQLRADVAIAQKVLRDQGVTKGDRVAAVMPNIPKTVVYMLATASLGAVWSSCSPDFGAGAILDRFLQIQPKVLLWANAYSYKAKWHSMDAKMLDVSAGLPSLNASIRVPFPGSQLSPTPEGCTDETAVSGEADPSKLEFTRVPFDAPLLIMFSSGTSGPPKCIVHSVGGTLLQHLKEHQLHSDIRPGDRLFYFSTCSWMMWNWLVSGLASRATIVLYDGSPFYPDTKALWRMAEQFQVTHFGTSPKYLETLRKYDEKISPDVELAKLRAVFSTGSPLSPANFEYVYRAVKSDVLLASISGGTDIVSCFLLGCPTLPVRAGELQCAGLGMNVRVFDETGHEPERGLGDLTCVTPFPSRPIGFWGDVSGARYHDAYYSSFENIWCQHDRIERRPSGGYIVHGRSDATLNPGGVRIGTAEIYRALENLDDVADCVVVGHDIGDDVEVVLFVVPKPGTSLSDQVVRSIKQAIGQHCTPRHVPARILGVPDIPRTRNGKTSEIAVRAIVNKTTVANFDQLENPECLKHFGLVALV
ncbi:acetoacetate--CoA ligase [Pacificoceanicola onchidii]|uniref:acetoacetate--CoA ligase n=1 Tax=Pacificoceanicola onchidii TaxID=2562685 RepID=UPI0010A334C5|nr:acetoacetate--CoA ligase [Pacificoceanicola onchidii]